MTALQAFFGQVAGRPAKAPGDGRIRPVARTVLGLAFLVALLVAGLALRVLTFAPLS